MKITTALLLVTSILAFPLHAQSPTQCIMAEQMNECMDANPFDELNPGDYQAWSQWNTMCYLSWCPPF